MTPADLAEAERIKNRLRGAPDAAALALIRGEERDAFEKLGQRPGCEVLAIQIKNLVNHMLRVEYPYQAANKPPP